MNFRSFLFYIFIISLISLVRGVTVSRIRRGTLTLGENDEEVDIAISPAIGDLSKTFVIGTCAYGGIKTGPAHVLFKLTSDSNLRAERAIGTEVVECDWQIAEFSDGISVRRGTTASQVLENLDLSKSFVILHFRLGGVEWDEDDFKRAVLSADGTTGVRVQVLPAGGQVAWQVVTCDDCLVTRAFFTMQAADSSKTSGWRSNFTPSRTSVISTYKIRNNGNDDSPAMCNVAISPRVAWNAGNGNMRLEALRCTAGPSRLIDVSYEIVKWLDATVVNYVDVTMSDSESWVTPYTGPMVPARTLLMPNVLPHVGTLAYDGTHAAADDRMGLALLSCRIQSETMPYAVNCSRLDSSSTSNTANVVGALQIVEFAGTQTLAPTAAPTVAPMGSPTSHPTVSPVRSPTHVPTANPTRAPTTTPTKGPTEPPGAPSRAPTRRPTLAPTIATTSTAALTTTKSVRTTSVSPEGGATTSSDDEGASTSGGGDAIVDDGGDGLSLSIVVGVIAAIAVCLIIALCLFLSRRQRGHVRRSERMRAGLSMRTSSPGHSRQGTPLRTRANSRMTPTKMRSRSNTNERRGRTQLSNQTRKKPAVASLRGHAPSLVGVDQFSLVDGFDVAPQHGTSTTELVFTEYDSDHEADTYETHAPVYANLSNVPALAAKAHDNAEPVVYSQLPS